MPGKPFQSKLLPHLDFIRERRAEGIGYRQIAAELQARFGLRTAPGNVFSFVKVRARRRPVFALPAREPAAPSPPRQAPKPTATRPHLLRLPAVPPNRGGNWLNYDPEKPLEKLR